MRVVILAFAALLSAVVSPGNLLGQDHAVQPQRQMRVTTISMNRSSRFNSALEHQSAAAAQHTTPPARDDQTQNYQAGAIRLTSTNPTVTIEQPGWETPGAESQPLILQPSTVLRQTATSREVPIVQMGTIIDCESMQECKSGSCRGCGRGKLCKRGCCNHCPEWTDEWAKMCCGTNSSCCFGLSSFCLFNWVRDHACKSCPQCYSDWGRQFAGKNNRHHCRCRDCK